MINWTEDRPPRLPENPYEMERAVMLLGNLWQQGVLKKSRREELEQILGELPTTAEQTQIWKRALKYWRGEMGW